MRISDPICAVLVAGMLSACNSADGEQAARNAALAVVAHLRAGAVKPEPAPVIACAVGGAAWAERCSYHWAPQSGQKARVLSLIAMRDGSAAGGGFRRIVIEGDDVREADGAQPLRIIGQDETRVEIAIAGDHYRLPLSLFDAPSRPHSAPSHPASKPASPRIAQ